MHSFLICIFLFGGICLSIRDFIKNYSELNNLSLLEKSCQGTVNGEIISCEKETRRIDTEHDVEKDEDTDFTIYNFIMGYMVNNINYQLKTESLRVKNVAINKKEVSNIGDKVEIKYNLENPSQSYCPLFVNDYRYQLKLSIFENIFLCCSVIVLSILGFYLT